MNHNDAVLNDLFHQVELLNQKLSELVMAQKSDPDPHSHLHSHSYSHSSSCSEPVDDLFEMPHTVPSISRSRRVFDELNLLPIMQRFKTTQRADGEHGHGWLNVSNTQDKWGVNFSVTDSAVALHCGGSVEPHFIDYCKRKRVELIKPIEGFVVIDRRLARQRRHWQRPSYRWVMTERQRNAPNPYASLLEMAREASLFLF